MSAPPEPLRVLVIDDDKALAETIAESLERRGHVCTVATSGKAGAAKLDDEPFDVVLTDLKMVDLGGLAVRREVPARAARRRGVRHHRLRRLEDPRSRR